jgi:hypothetical protein
VPLPHRHFFEALSQLIADQLCNREHFVERAWAGFMPQFKV